MPDAVESGLHIVAKVADGIVNTMEACHQSVVQSICGIADALLDCLNTSLNVVECEAVMNGCTCFYAVPCTCKAAATETTAESTAPAAAEQGEQDDQTQKIITEQTVE